MKFCWLPHEAADRYEPFSEVGRFLASTGFDAVHWSALGAANAPDSEIVQRIGKQVVDALRQLESELSRGVLVTIEPEWTRLRILLHVRAIE